MAARQKRWSYRPPRLPKPTVPDAAKADVEATARELIEAVLKPAHVKPPPEDMRFNYLVDIYAKWYRNYFYFCSRYRCPGPNAIAPFLRPGLPAWNTLTVTAIISPTCDTLGSGGRFIGTCPWQNV
jgi:hypothetical protein